MILERRAPAPRLVCQERDRKTDWARPFLFQTNKSPGAVKTRAHSSLAGINGYEKETLQNPDPKPILSLKTM
jgi:hypothetical protein